VGWTQIIFGAVLVLVLLFVAILYIVRQIIALRRLRAAEEMPLEEHAYLYSRARRRLITSLLMFLLGGMLVVDLLFLEVPAQQLADHQHERMQREGDVPPLDEEQRSFARVYGWFFIFFLIVLMVVVFMAALDYWATRRYGLRQHRKIMDDRRAMIEREISRLRRERNGHA
jgi:flagellar biosynthesis/type III secretory pathway M-ring protein FliF/YscJ